MSLGGMVAKSIMSYVLFRGTRAVAKAGCDAVESIGSDEKICRCPRCGEFEIAVDNCSFCGTKMHKMYQEWTPQTRLVDDNLLMEEN
jgi:ribosomal protein L37E